MKQESWMILRISLSHVSAVTLFMPLVSFLMCIYLSLLNNYDRSTATHCNVPNYLPSISSAIGEFVPQRNIWRTAIALHSSPRFIFALLYYHYMKKIIPPIPPYQILRFITFICNVVENLALIGLSFVSSRENYGVHKFCFVLFMISSILYMVLTYLLIRDNTALLTKSSQRFAWSLKKKLLLLNVVSFAVSLYFFYRHNQYCEPYMYTGFAFCEYLVVLSNMGFHMTAYYDFYDYFIIIGEKGTSCSDLPS